MTSVRVRFNFKGNVIVKITIKIIGDKNNAQHLVVNAHDRVFDTPGGRSIGCDFTMDLHLNEAIHEVYSDALEEAEKRLEQVKNAPPKTSIPNVYTDDDKTS